MNKTRGAVFIGTVIGLHVGKQMRMRPDGLAVFAPVTAVGPARQRLTGIPLALAVMEERTGGKAVLEPLDQFIG